MIDHSRKQGVTRTGKYSGHYNYNQERTPNEVADRQTIERLEAREDELDEYMQIYLENLRRKYELGCR